jgi:hypothetical protein
MEDYDILGSLTDEVGNLKDGVIDEGVFDSIISIDESLRRRVDAARERYYANPENINAVADINVRETDVKIRRLLSSVSVHLSKVLVDDNEQSQQQHNNVVRNLIIANREYENLMNYIYKQLDNTDG